MSYDIFRTKENKGKANCYFFTMLLKQRLANSLLYFSIFFFVTYIFAQDQVAFRQLSVKEGLSQNSAISITQDSVGYLWVATQDGLNKYDGRNFTTYPFTFVDITKPNYSNLGKVYTDRQGKLWIIPIDGIPHKLNIFTDTFEPLSNVMGASSIYQDTEYNIWIGTYSKGLYKLESNTSIPTLVISYNEVNGSIFDITENASGKIFLTTEKKIISYDLKTKTAHHIKPKNDNGNTIDQNFSAQVFDSNNKLWVGTYGNGLFYKDKIDPIFHRLSKTFMFGKIPNNLNIIDLHIDSKERLWVATYGSGLYLVDFNKKRITHFSAEKYNPKALHYNDVLCIYEDYSGTMWFGTDGAGISYYDEYLEKFNSMTNSQTPDEINIDVVRSLTVDNENKVWIGTSGKGLTQYNPSTESWQNFRADKTKTTIASDRIMSLLVANDNQIWIGTQGDGLSILDTDGNFTNFTATSNPPLSANTIWCIYKDSNNRIWLGTREQGLVQFDSSKGEIQKYQTENNELPSNNIRVITEDQTGNLWIGTENNGLAFFNVQNEIFRSYEQLTSNNSLSSNNIKSLYYAPNKILWIGTNGGGLNAFDIENQKFYTYTIENGLPNNVIYAILPDEKENLWLSSNKGISKFTPGATFADLPKIKNYTNYAGLATEFNTGAYHKGDNGNLYFGGLEGFYWFKPDEIKENKILPKTTITSFEVFNEPYSMLEERYLAHDKNTVSFTFSSLQYSLPEKNTYQYRLVNYDDDWVYAGNNNFARYTQLPPGNYTFQAKSSNYDGVWNELPESFNFTIASPWYFSFTAKIIYLLLFLSIILGVYGYLKWRWKMQFNLQLKEEEAERLKKLNEFKSNLYTDIAHEFKTPLTLISGPIDQKLSQGKLSDFDHANFSMVKRNTTRLTVLVDQLLELAKLEDGKLKLRIIKGDLALFLHTIAQSFEYQAYLKDIDYAVEIESLGELWYDEDIIEKILTNLLSNAFKYTPKEGICNFSVKTNSQYVCISTKNSVINTSKLELDKLFTRFYQHDEYAEGMGVGLSLVQELTKFYGGTINVQMEKNDIIHFKLKLPVDRSIFPKYATIKESEDSISVAPSLDVIDVDFRYPEDSIEKLPILLIVEDHQEVRTFMKLALQKKYQILEAENGKVGMEIALSQIPDIILSDIRMPLKNGIQLCNTLKIDQRTSHIPIILLTAGMGEEGELSSLNSGADDYVIKPFKINILEQRIANLIALRRSLRERYSQELILKPKDIAVTPSDETFLHNIQRILDEHLSDPQFNAASFSKKAKMSRMQLHRKLLTYTGLSTTAFIRSQRLKQALQILETTDLTINEVAYSTGFNTPGYFIKCFKKQFQLTPTEYSIKKKT